MKIHMFHRDLQEQILNANRDFIAQAEERAAAARDAKEKKPAVLSALEAALQANCTSPAQAARGPGLLRVGGAGKATRYEVVRP